jgi:hypothetical protein
MTNGDDTIDVIEQFFADGELPGGFKLSKKDKLLLLALKQVRTEVCGKIDDVADFVWGEDKDPRDEKSLSFKVQRNSRVIKGILWASGIVVVAILGAVGSAIAGIIPGI